MALLLVTLLSLDLYFFDSVNLISSGTSDYAYISSLKISNSSVPITASINVSMTYTLVYDSLTSLGYAKIELIDPVKNVILASKINYTTGDVSWKVSFYLDPSIFHNLTDGVISVVGKVVIDGSYYYEDTAIENFTLRKAETLINITASPSIIYYNNSFVIQGELINVDNVTWLMNSCVISLSVENANKEVLIESETKTNSTGHFYFSFYNTSLSPSNYSLILEFNGSYTFKNATNVVTLRIVPRIARIISYLNSSNLYTSSTSQDIPEYISVSVQLIDEIENESLMYYLLRIFLNESLIFSKNVTSFSINESILLPDVPGTYFLTLVAKKTNYDIGNVTYLINLQPRPVSYFSLKINNSSITNSTLYFGSINFLSIHIIDFLTNNSITNSTAISSQIRVFDSITTSFLNCTLISSNFSSEGIITLKFIMPFNIYLEYLNNSFTTKSYTLMITITLNDPAYDALVILINMSELSFQLRFISEIKVNNLNVEKGNNLSLSLSVFLHDVTNTSLTVYLSIDDTSFKTENVSANTNFYLNISINTESLSIGAHNIYISFCYSFNEIKLLQVTFWVWLRTWMYINITLVT